MRRMRTFGKRPPELDRTDFPGKLFVIEGPDGSGRSTQIELLARWLESNGFAVHRTGLRRSNLVSEELEQAKEGNILTRTTMSLFYATDFFDQMLNGIVPALRAGFIVLADRYIYTLMARDIVRGADPAWVADLYGPTLVPDAVFYLRVSSKHLMERTFQKRPGLDYWESGMDLGLSSDMFDSFLKYQRMIQAEFRAMQERFDFEVVNANLGILRIHRDLQRQIARLLELPPQGKAPTP
jgi:dTMP kinase